MIALSPLIYERGAAGVFSNTIFARDLRDRIDSYEHTISDRFGFESMSISMRATDLEINEWLQNGLMRSVVVYSPDAGVVWEGYLETISATLGQKKASRSLKSMGNRVRVLFTGTNGTPQSSSILNNTESQGLYGIKDRMATLQKTSQTTANNAANTMIASYAFPRSDAETEARTGRSGEGTLKLAFAGWYQTIEWAFSGLNSLIFTDTGTQVIARLTTLAGINAFLSNDYTNIPTSGITDSEYVPPNTTHRPKIETLLLQGNSSNQQLTWGVYEDRIFKVAVWAGATPTNTTYREDARTGVIFDAYGNIVNPWDVRPNAMSEVLQLIDVGPSVGTVDAASRRYIGRVRCSVSGDRVGCALESSNVDSFDAALATFKSYS